MENAKEKFTSVRVSNDLHKALSYAKIETGKNIEIMTQEAVKAYLLELGFLKESGEVNKPEPIVTEKSDLTEE